ncbi:exonuclease domain-containing protein [Thauera sp. WH-2]|jgi:DNA polymerase-3 subunit epsilon|uniref:exonuclease domain-containing protein n=1 Tax=unclassified Thauera TaxID=2609274 RepID=UPI003AB0B2C9
MSLPRRFAIIDVESTGAHPVRDRITEIAILRVEDGEVRARWESLIAPGQPIPPLIEEVTGISDAMVADAPTFDTVADKVAGLLEGCVFVAHSARFDFGFIKNAFERIGRSFDAEVLCTVKLSRALYPQHHKHGLDALIERHGLVCTIRHRAMGDVDVLWQFVRQVQAAFPEEILARAVARAMKAPAQPPGLAEGELEAIPDVPGLYLFYAEPEAMAGRREVPLFVGRAQSLRARVREHFGAAARKGRDAELAARVRRVEWVETAGELDTSLREAALLRNFQPRFNRPHEPADGAFALRLLPNRKRPPIFEAVPVAGTDPAAWSGQYGVFRNRREADNVLRELAMLYRLCPQRLGLEGGTGPCSAHGSRRCAGVCARRESAAEHDARLAGALEGVGPRAWPWGGAVAVEETHAVSGRHRLQLFDRWCHLGSVDAEAGEVALRERAVTTPRCFDVDLWRMFARWLAVPAHLAQVRPLEPSAVAR